MPGIDEPRARTSGLRASWDATLQDACPAVASRRSVREDVAILADIDAIVGRSWARKQSAECGTSSCRRLAELQRAAVRPTLNRRPRRSISAKTASGTEANACRCDSILTGVERQSAQTDVGDDGAHTEPGSCRALQQFVTASP